MSIASRFKKLPDWEEHTPSQRIMLCLPALRILDEELEKTNVFFSPIHYIKVAYEARCLQALVFEQMREAHR